MNTQTITDGRGNAVTWSTVLSISIAAHADPRSVRRWIEGEHLRGQVSQRIAEAAKLRGVEPHPPPHPLPTYAQALAVARRTGVPLFRVEAFARGKTWPAETTARLVAAIRELGLADLFPATRR